MSRILILYGTRTGATAETANEIAGVLRDEFKHEVDVVDAKRWRLVEAAWSAYSAAVVGSSIMAGRWKPAVLRFLKATDFSGKKLFLFVTAAATLHFGAETGKAKEASVAEAVALNIDARLAGMRGAPALKTAFGGRLVMFGKERFDNWDASDIRAWAREVGKAC